jgi:hypothetical protein
MFVGIGKMLLKLNLTSKGWSVTKNPTNNRVKIVAVAKTEILKGLFMFITCSQCSLVLLVLSLIPTHRHGDIPEGDELPWSHVGPSICWIS